MQPNVYLKMLKSKIHRAVVTATNLDYEGSITIDADLLEAADLLVYEEVQVVNLNNGARFETYVIPGARGQGEVILNGAAARLAVPGDRVIIMAFVYCPAETAREFKPRLVLVDDGNRLRQERSAGRPPLDSCLTEKT